MSAFKHRPNKLKYRTDTTTLDEIHKSMMSKFDSNYKKLEYLSKTEDLIVGYYEKLSGDQYDSTKDGKIEYYDLNEDREETILETEQEIEKQDINDEKTENSEDDAVISIDPSDKLKMFNLLSRKNRKTKKPIKKRKITNIDNGNKSIFQFFTQEISVKDMENEKDELLTKLNRAELQEKFLFLVDKNYACGKVRMQKNVLCSNCNIEKTLFSSEGCYICKKCGETEEAFMENENNNYKETNFEKQKYPYKKINHLKEKLNQFQSKETADVPDEIYTMIINDLKKKRIRPEYASPADIKSILKKNRETNYYEHLQQIYCKITKSQPITLSREIETMIIGMFQAMQESFQKHRPDDRSNFLSYAYVLNKLFRIVGLEQHSKFFYLLKSKEKLRDQDNIWAKICRDMGWKFFSSF
jgi:hypothetical protein